MEAHIVSALLVHFVATRYQKNWSMSKKVHAKGMKQRKEGNGVVKSEEK